MSEHHHHHPVSGKNLFITIVLNIIITLSQIVGGILSGSLALLSDAMHNLSDVVALLIAYWANKISSKPKNNQKTFGYKRAEIIAALFNASALFGIALFLIIEAIHKFLNPETIDSILVIALGFLSIVLNAISVLLIKDDAKHNMNMKAAYVHLLTDVMTSVAVVVGGLLMYYFNLFWIDSIITVLIAGYLIKASYALIVESISILMQSVPDDINIDELKIDIEKYEPIDNIHHLHIWKLDDHDIHLEAHIDFNENLALKEVTKICDEISDAIKKKYHITHMTIQPEYEKNDNKELIYS
ncbi:cation diffusion facilitator family transporter [Psychromonas ingrahamii 37]|uniref:Cation diffusion facilitator family transporter n=1 Tax=Psychromonas ingrahamii (strain DSM 17664 / CCUG 51855 / 37) TaxID=357804 RepID=A1SW56_PSYIN|nr:cation diffusion facilitator family transporter [Psychromonas ingrahamii]ABM03721.1 cation diffusion facilitator family transporter [Psychromonas ingrahamii 37]